MFLLCPQVRLWVPAIVDKYLENTVAEDLLRALTGPILPCEEEGGWILAQKNSGKLRTATLRGHIRALGDFIDYLFTDALALGFDAQRWSPLIGVSQHDNKRFDCLCSLTVFAAGCMLLFS